MKNTEVALPLPSEVHGRVSVETPEQIQFTFELAGAGSRMMAYGIDLSIRIGVALFVSLVVLISTGWAAPGLASGLVLVLFFSLEWGYHTVIEWLWNGYTPGKWALGIRVVRRDGVAVDFPRSAMRNLLRAADIFPMGYATGLFVIFFSNTQRRLGDLAADVMVIRERKVRLRALPPLPSETIVLPPDTIDALHLDEKAMTSIDEFFRRRHMFSQERSEELAKILATPLAEKLGISRWKPIPLLGGIILAGHERRSTMLARAESSPPPYQAETQPSPQLTSTPPPSTPSQGDIR